MNRYIIMAKKLADRFEKESMYLCDLDRKAGDGDHGITIARGFEEACNNVSKLPEDTPASEVCKEIGYGMLRSMGGASGPIFSTFFIQASIVLKGKEGWDADSFVETVHAAIAGIHDLAGTNRNEKTMLDAMYGSQDALDEGKPSTMAQAVKLAYEGAKKGAESTKEWLQQKEAQSLSENVRKDLWMPEAVASLLCLKLSQKFLEETNESNIRLR